MEQFLIDITAAGTQLASDAAANALLPGSGIALKGARSFGDASQEARLAGANVGQQLAYGGLTAGKDVILEKAVDGFVGTYGEGLANNIIKKSAKDETRHEALERLLGISGETMGAFFKYT